MMHVSPPRGVAIAKADDQSWRRRTAMACSLMAMGVVGFSAARIDWSPDLAMSVGEFAGLVAPIAMIILAAWGLCAWVGGRR
jgi:hypothetical protein